MGLSLLINFNHDLVFKGLNKDQFVKIVKEERREREKKHGHETDNFNGSQ